MICPFCRHETTAVADSRLTGDMAAVRRRRRCESCGARFTTYERYEQTRLIVAKRSGARKVFDEEKVLRSLELATAKRGMSAADLAALTAAIVQDCHALGGAEISTGEIGVIVLRHLRKADHVAFIRYASVYRQFAGPRDFARFLAEEALF